MSAIDIEVIDVTETEEPKKKGGGVYKVLTVTHKNSQGKIDAKKLYDFATPTELWETMKKAEKGAVFNVEREKDKTGQYWNWSGVHRQDSMPKPAGPAPGIPTPTRPTYETPEERAQKQVYIVRQSSIASAIELVKLNVPKGGVSPDDVISIAEQFERYVFGTRLVDLSDDIPE